MSVGSATQRLPAESFIRMKIMASTVKQPHLLEAIVLLLILALAATLRLANIADNPGWYADEGTHLDIAQHLLRGRVQYLAVTQSTLLFAKLPLFEGLLAGLLRIFGGGIGTLRAFTGALGVISAAVLYSVARRMSGDRALALMAALLLAIYPQAVTYSRFGFSYNLLTPLVLLVALGCWEYLSTARRRWLALAALAIGLGGISDLWMFTLVAPLTVSVLKRNWHELLWSLPLVALLFSLFAVVMLITSPQSFWFDLRFTLLRLGRLSLWEQTRSVARNIAILLFQDAWMALGLVGLFLLRPARLQKLSLLLFLLPVLILGRTTALYSLGFYYMIPLLPFVALGMAALLRRGAEFVLGCGFSQIRTDEKLWRCALLLVIALPFVASLAFTLEQVRGGFQTAINPFLLHPGDVRRAAQFTNAHTTPDDVVIASPGLAWLLRTNAADVQQAIAATGQATPDLPGDIPAERFAFDPRYARARFVVVDNLWHNAVVWDVPGAAEMLRQVEMWPQVFEAGEIRVYRNPNK